MVLDTNLISMYIERRAREKYPRIVEFIDESSKTDEIYVSYITVYELRRGLAKLDYHNASDRRREAQKKRVQLDKLFRRAKLLSLDPGGWDVAASLWAKGQVHGPAINYKETDLLIAATALWHEVPLATAELKPAMAEGLAILAPELELHLVREDPRA